VCACARAAEGGNRYTGVSEVMVICACIKDKNRNKSVDLRVKSGQNFEMDLLRMRVELTQSA
jgi:hypothetical protein